MTRTVTVYVSEGPPDNEIPVALAPGAAWGGESAVYAVPSLLVYTTGAELLVMYRTRDAQPRTIEHARASFPLHGLTVNGRPVDPLSGSFGDHGWTYRAWLQFREGDFGTGLILNLEWPGIPHAEHCVDGVREAVQRVAIIQPA